MLFWEDISSPVTYSYLSVLPDDNADNFAAVPVMSYCGFSCLIFSSIVNFHQWAIVNFLCRSMECLGSISDE